MLQICHANYLEDLADQLALDLFDKPSDALVPELIGVPGQAIADWLSLRMASNYGIVANVRRLLPAEIIWHLFRSVLSNVPSRNEFSVEVLAWRILACLDDKSFVLQHPPISDYLASGDLHNRWQLARNLGHLYGQYLIYRPDWILQWQYKDTKDWQGSLWNRLVSKGSDRHWLALYKEMHRSLKQHAYVRDRLPNRISLFALPALSGTYLEIMQELSVYMEVRIYHQNFSSGYWGEILSEKEREQLIAQSRGVSPAYLEAGNPILASMGRQGREQLLSLLELESKEIDKFREPSSRTLLGRIQRDIFAMEGENDLGGFLLNEADQSLQLHICHSMMREIEILHDQLLALLDDDLTLDTSDILVLIPNLALYAPHVEAVFGTARGKRYLPWSLTGKGMLDQPLTKCFINIFDLINSRFETDKVIGLLEEKVIANQFGLLEADIELIRKWVRNIGISWGADRPGVSDLGFNTGYQHTWRSGLDRLLLSHAVGEKPDLFSGVLPGMPLSSSEAQVVGRLCTFIEELIMLIKKSEVPRTVLEWVSVSNQILDRFFCIENKYEIEIRHLRDGLSEVAERATAGNYMNELPMTIYLDALKAQFSDKVSGKFMTGGITFAPLNHGACVPSRVMCILGLDDSFPRHDRSYSFNLIRQKPRFGDRRQRDEDQHAFLEALLSARQKLYISYVGRDVRDDSEKSASVLVREVINYASRICGTTFSTTNNGPLTVVHPLQAFSAKYFTGEDSRLFSYASEFLPNADSQISSPKELNLQSLQVIEITDVELENLIQFFCNPAQMLLRDRLNISLKRPRTWLPACEPMALDWIELKNLSEAAMQAQLKEESWESFIDRWHANGKLPSATPGDLVLAEAWSIATEIRFRLQQILPEKIQRDLMIDIHMERFRLRGTLRNVNDAGLLSYTFSRPSIYDLLRFWLSHLTLSASPEVNVTTSRMLIPGKTLVLSKVRNGAEFLQELAALYEEGMNQPLAFFPRSAWAYVKAAQDPNKAAQKEWLGSDYSRGEGDDPYYTAAFEDVEDSVLGSKFAILAKQILGPLRKHLIEESK